MRRVASVLFAVMATATACGKKAPPTPPAPRGPLPPRLVEARQLGQEVRVAFTLSEPRGAHPTQRPHAAELVRVEFPPGSQPTDDPDAFRRRGRVVARLDVAARAPGERLALADEGLAELSNAGEGWTLRYGVRVVDRRGRLSPLVVARDLDLLRPPPAPVGLVAEATGEGIRLRWDAGGGDAVGRYSVYRRAPGEPAPERAIHPEPVSRNEYLDATAVPGSTYEYEVRAAAADGMPLRESAPSASIAVLAEDRSAPAPPERLVAVQERRAVRLFWNPSPERDVAGYRVYRRGSDGAWRAIGPALVDRPLHLDTAIESGQRLAYRVTAVDRAQPPNESLPSAEVEFDVGEEPTEP
jgi:hypothetical protein